MNHSPLQIDMVQQHPVIHLKLRTTADDLTLQLELDDGDRLVHLGDQTGGLLIHCIIGELCFRHE